MTMQEGKTEKRQKKRLLRGKVKLLNKQLEDAQTSKQSSLPAKKEAKTPKPDVKTPKPKAKILIPEAETKAPKDELWGGIQVVDLKKGSGPECERGNNVGRKVESLSSSSLSKTKSSRARMWECGHCWCGWRRMKAANSSEACLRGTGSSARYYSPLHSIHPSV